MVTLAATAAVELEAAVVVVVVETAVVVVEKNKIIHYLLNMRACMLSSLFAILV
jgi:hypothetical protein